MKNPTRSILNRPNSILAVAGIVSLVTLSVASIQPRESRGQPLPAPGSDRLDHVLVFSGTGWYRHPDVPVVNGWLVRIGAEYGIQVDVSESGHDIRPENLAHYDAIILNNANELIEVLDDKQRRAFREWFEDGGSLVATHATFVHQTEWDWFYDLAGTDFDSDSRFLKARVVVDSEATDHPAVAGRGPEFWYEADWTNHTESVTGLPGVEVLLRVDETTYDAVRPFFQARGGKPMGEDHPVAWTREYRGGRLFYTELGHDIRSLDTDFGRAHLMGGLQWVVANNATDTSSTAEPCHCARIETTSVDPKEYD